MNVWLGEASFDQGAVGPRVIAVPGAAKLEAVERNIDYAALPAVQREMLEDLRARLDAGQLEGAQTDHKDLVGMGLARVVGVGEFEQGLKWCKEEEDRPWAEVPEGVKVRVPVDLSQVHGPPGAYVLEAIKREVDYGQLPSWRREALEGLRTRLDRGELSGGTRDPLDLDGHVDVAVRLAELKARIEDEKRFASLDGPERPVVWQELGEDEKFDRIVREIRDLQLESESAAYYVLGREVDMRGVPQEQRRVVEDSQAEARPGSAESEPDAFDRVVTNLRQEWYDDGYGSPRDSWEQLPADEKIAYLSHFAVAHDVPLRDSPRPPEKCWA